MSTDLTNQEKLEEIYKLAIENNNMLHRLQSRARLTTILQILYWLAIAGALGGVYYYIRPVLNSFATNGTKAEGLLHQLQDLRSQMPETKAFQQFLRELRSDNTDTASTPVEEATTTP